MTEPLISVIVPVYKVELYLRQCVDSIINQTYCNLEIILVDDGSPDNCGAICDEYAVQDKRVRVIHKENGGLSDARNTGMAVMTGDYLMFVDSDDSLTPDAIEILYRLITEHDADLAIGSSDRVDINGKKLPETGNMYQSTSSLSRTEAVKDMLLRGCAAWARLYKREVHEGIHFPTGEINEDEAIVLAILNRCQKVITTDHVVYHYLCRADSITTNQFSKKKLAWKNNCQSNLHFIQKNYPSLTKDAAARYRDSLLWSLYEIAMMGNSAEYKTEIDAMMNELKVNHPLLVSTPFDAKKEWIHYWLLRLCGFKIYRRIFQIKRAFSHDTL